MSHSNGAASEWVDVGAAFDVADGEVREFTITLLHGSAIFHPMA